MFSLHGLILPRLGVQVFSRQTRIISVNMGHGGWRCSVAFGAWIVENFLSHVLGEFVKIHLHLNVSLYQSVLLRRQCCIAAKCYSIGARFMDDRPIFGVEPVATGLTPVHFLRHFYYGGIVYIGAKQWKDALDSFLMVSSVDVGLRRFSHFTSGTSSLNSAICALISHVVCMHV